MAKIWIGTSGFCYPHWRKGVFYPKKLPRNKELEYYAKHFKTVELNAPFYHLPKPEVFANWRKRTPKGFLFSVKVSRYITHVKKLSAPKEPWRRFIESARELREKLGVILFQLPPRFKMDLKKLQGLVNILPKKYTFAFEFRHISWFCEEVYQILRKANLGLVVSSPLIGESFKKRKKKKDPSPLDYYRDYDHDYDDDFLVPVTADFVYHRLHGSSRYNSKYTDKELKGWARVIKGFYKEGCDVFVYFNNDVGGYAVENARELIKMTK